MLKQNVEQCQSENLGQELSLLMERMENPEMISGNLLRILCKIRALFRTSAGDSGRDLFSNLAGGWGNSATDLGQKTVVGFGQSWRSFGVQSGGSFGSMCGCSRKELPPSGTAV